MNILSAFLKSLSRTVDKPINSSFQNKSEQKDVCMYSNYGRLEENTQSSLVKGIRDNNREQGIQMKSDYMIGKQLKGGKRKDKTFQKQGVLKRRSLNSNYAR